MRCLKRGVWELGRWVLAVVVMPLSTGLALAQTSDQVLARYLQDDFGFGQCQATVDAMRTATFASEFWREYRDELEAPILDYVQQGPTLDHGELANDVASRLEYTPSDRREFSACAREVLATRTTGDRFLHRQIKTVSHLRENGEIVAIDEVELLSFLAVWARSIDVEAGEGADVGIDACLLSNQIERSDFARRHSVREHPELAWILEDVVPLARCEAVEAAYEALLVSDREARVAAAEEQVGTCFAQSGPLSMDQLFNWDLLTSVPMDQWDASTLTPIGQFVHPGRAIEPGGLVHIPGFVHQLPVSGDENPIVFIAPYAIDVAANLNPANTHGLFSSDAVIHLPNAQSEAARDFGDLDTALPVVISGTVRHAPQTWRIEVSDTQADFTASYVLAASAINAFECFEP